MLRETDTAKNQCAAKLNSLTQPYITKQRKISSLKTIQERIYRDAKFFYDMKITIFYKMQLSKRIGQISVLI
jgi:hypothetical protein